MGGISTETIPTHHQLLSTSRDQRIALGGVVPLVFVRSLEKQHPLIQRPGVPSSFLFSFVFPTPLFSAGHVGPSQFPSSSTRQRFQSSRRQSLSALHQRSGGVNVYQVFCGDVEIDLFEPFCLPLFSHWPTCQPPRLMLTLCRGHSWLDESLTPMCHPVSNARLAPTFVGLIISNRRPDKACPQDLRIPEILPHQPGSEHAVSYPWCAVLHTIQVISVFVFAQVGLLLPAKGSAAQLPAQGSAVRGGLP